MPLKEVLTYEFKQPYYLRFTCEKCGCRTHWIPGKIISTEVAERKGQYNKTATAANGTVSTLINIIKTLSDDDTGGGKLAGLIASLNDE